jgi:hypothetical protein
MNINMFNNRNKYIRILIGVFMSLVIFLPIVSFAAGLVPCGGAGEPVCDFNMLMTLINRLINFILFSLAVPLAAIMFAYAGILLLTSGGNSSQKEKAKKVFTGVAIGLVIAAAAWLIVHVILSILGYSGGWIGF